MRKEALAEAQGDTLEVGFGTGLNLRCYPAGVLRLVGLDAESMLESLVAARIKRSPFPVERFTLDASGRLPFADSSFDTVVTTFTLCSILDVEGALAEMRRVIKPSGRFLFLEHGRSDDRSIAKWQDRLNRVQNLIARGCNINRKIDSLVQQAGFRIDKLERFDMPDTPRILGTMYRGIACLEN